MSGFSSRGPTRDGRNKPDLVAPGQTVETTRSFSHSSINLGQLMARLTAFAEGTSFAAPHVAGLVALMLQFKRDLTPQQVRAILRATAVQPPGGPVQNTWDEGWGYGRLDGVAAVADLVWRYNQNPALVADGLTAAGSGESR